MSRDPTITSRIMSKIRSKDTKAEMLLRKALWGQGLRYRKNYKPLKGTPDIVFMSKRVVIFVDGDFWHGHNWRIRNLRRLDDEFSEEKKSYWLPKIRRNVERDEEVNEYLRKTGWKVLRFWESDIKKDIQSVVRRILVDVID